MRIVIITKVKKNILLSGKRAENSQIGGLLMLKFILILFLFLNGCTYFVAKETIENIKQNYSTRGELWFPVNLVLNHDVRVRKNLIKNENEIKKNEHNILKKRQKFLDIARNWIESKDNYNIKLSQKEWTQYQKILIPLWNKIYIDKIDKVLVPEEAIINQYSAIDIYNENTFI